MKVEAAKDRKISFRINQADYDYLEALAFMAGVSVSRYIRMLIDGSVNACRIAEKEGKINLENVKAVRNDKL